MSCQHNIPSLVSAVPAMFIQGDTSAIEPESNTSAWYALRIRSRMPGTDAPGSPETKIRLSPSVAGVSEKPRGALLFKQTPRGGETPRRPRPEGKGLRAEPLCPGERSPAAH